MTGSTISAGYPKALLDFAARKGAERRELLERSGLRLADLDAQDNRVPLSSYLALFEASADLTGEPGIALQFGKAVHARTHEGAQRFGCLARQRLAHFTQILSSRRNTASPPRSTSTVRFQFPAATAAGSLR